MKTSTYLAYATVMSAAGSAFAGYLGYTRMTSGVCAFAEPCPSFLGQPACYTGFVLFAVMLVVSAIASLLRVRSTWPAAANAAVAGAGTVFAMRMTLGEIGSGVHYRLGLPTCAYGLVFFVAMLILSLYASGGQPHRHAAASPR